MKYPIKLKIKVAIYIVLVLITFCIGYLAIAEGSNGFILISLLHMISGVIVGVIAYALRLDIKDCLEDFK